MKKHLCILTAVLLLAAAFVFVTPGAQAASSKISVRFPDTAFRNYVLSEIDTDKDGYLSSAEIQKVTKLTLLTQQIADFTGIEMFTNLDYLSVTNNTAVTELNIYGLSSLKTLWVEGNANLKSATILYCDALSEVTFWGNDTLEAVDGLADLPALTLVRLNRCPALTSAEVAGNQTLKTFWATYVALPGDMFSDLPALESLAIANAGLTSVSFTDLPSLVSLSVNDNDLSKLDVSAYPNLVSLNCSGNKKITKLNLMATNKLLCLICNKCNLTEIDISDTRLFLDDPEEGYASYLGNQCSTSPTVYMTEEQRANWTTWKYQENSCRVGTVPYVVDENGIAIDETNFPDAALRAWVKKNADKYGARNSRGKVIGDGYLKANERMRIDSITLTDAAITNLTGLEHFTCCTSLTIDGCTALTDIEDCAALMTVNSVSSRMQRLTDLTIMNSGLTKLDLGENYTIQYLTLSGNKLTDLRFNTWNTYNFKSIICTDEPGLTYLYLAGMRNLEYLNLSRNGLYRIDMPTYTTCGESLKTLVVADNPKLSSLNLSMSTGLENLICSGCGLKKLDISKTNCLTAQSAAGKLASASVYLGSQTTGDLLVTATDEQKALWDSPLFTAGDAVENPENARVFFDTTDGWKKVHGVWYYRVNGASIEGFKKIGTKWYYLDPDTHIMATGWRDVGSKRYYMDKNGVMKTKWLKLSGKYYYLGTDGAMVKGWKKVSGKWYYLDKTTGVMATKWKKLSGKYYYLGTDGAMRTGWLTLSGKTYYLDSNGVMQTGWVEVDDEWYYMNSSGAMQTGWITLSGKKYYLDPTDGHMYTDEDGVVDGYKFKKSGVAYEA